VLEHYFNEQKRCGRKRATVPSAWYSQRKRRGDVSMKRNTQAFLLAGMAVLSAAADPPKMCWAHYVGWGFNQVDGYDRAALDPIWNAQRFNDRSLLGRHAQTDEGVGEATKLQVRTAMQYGIDGFCVDLIIRPSSRETFYADAMSRFYRAAEGTAFKVAPCVDSTEPDAGFLTRAFAAYLERWGPHPNTCLVDGRPAIFIYNSRPRTLADWRQILDALKARGLAAYWLVQPMGEGTLWDNPRILADNLAVFDGFYDFGINGFSASQMLERLTNGRKALDAYRPGGLLAAGITQGYLGNGNSFYRPYLNSGTLRDTWSATLASGAPWVCLTTWNDYVEHTHFEPSVVNRDVPLRINRDYLAQWRGEARPPRPPQVFVSYHEEASLGDDWTLEALSLAYTTAPASVRVRLLDESGQPCFEPEPVELPRTNLTATTLRMPMIGLDGHHLFRVQVRFADADPTDVWRDLYPVTVRCGHLESLRTIRVPFDSLAAQPTLALKTDGGTRVALVRFERWNLAGRVELLRNGWPVAATEFAHKDAPSVTLRLPIPAEEATPADIYVARYSTLSGDVSWSAPARFTPATPPAVRACPVVVTGSDFDEGWWGGKVSRFARPAVTNIALGADEAYALTYPMVEGAGTALPSVSGWRTPLLLGRHHKWMQTNDAWRPQWTNDGGRAVLRFDGADDCAILPSRSMPYGPFTLELRVKPETVDHAMTFFADACGVSLTLSADGRLHFSRRKDAVASKRVLAANRWTHLAAVYDGKTLQLYIDGKPDADAPAETQVIRINSLSVLGNGNAFDAGFKGLIGGFHLQSGVSVPARFVLDCFQSQSVQLPTQPKN